MGIKAIVFDYGQVISYPQDPLIVGELARRAGVERERFEPLLWGLRGEYDRGKIDVREYYRRIFSRLNVNPDDKSVNEMIAMDLASWKSVNPETVALMEGIKKAGYGLGILSNMPRDFLAWARENVPAFSLPDKSVFSCEVGLIKPEEAIYRRLLSLFGAEGGELVFFDDSADNIRSAAALGIRAFLWKDAANARRDLESLGVRL